jgi:general secretion pathway protein H
MRTSVVGNSKGFTLLELLLVVVIMAVASAGVSFALRDSGQTMLEREAQRLAALLESARARSLASGVPVRWQVTPTGFVFEGLAPGSLPDAWLSQDVAVAGPVAVLLGPEPIIGPQAVRLVLTTERGKMLTVSTDGVRPFTVSSSGALAASP